MPFVVPFQVSAKFSEKREDELTNAAIWLGWWATSPDPSADLGKWLGVYVAFGVGSMLAAGLGIWYGPLNI